MSFVPQEIGTRRRGISHQVLCQPRLLSWIFLCFRSLPPACPHHITAEAFGLYRLCCCRLLIRHNLKASRHPTPLYRSDDMCLDPSSLHKHVGSHVIRAYLFPSSPGSQILQEKGENRKSQEMLSDDWRVFVSWPRAPECVAMMAWSGSRSEIAWEDSGPRSGHLPSPVSILPSQSALIYPILLFSITYKATWLFWSRSNSI